MGKLSFLLSVFVVVSLLLTPLGNAQAAAPALAASADAAPGALTFTSAGQALFFSAQGVAVSNGRYALRVTFAGANVVAPQAAPGGESGGKGAPPLTSVTYADLWDGIRLTYDRGSGVLRSTYLLAPGADPARIRLTYNRPFAIQPDGSLRIAFESGVLSESAPQAWQDLPGGRVPVAVRFAQVNERTLGFALGNYDPAYPLTIDPTLTWNTFLGGSGNDTGYTIAVDGNGNIYVSGYSALTWGSPVRPFSSGYDAFAAKLNPSGTLLWNTFLGGSGTDIGYAIAVDGSGNVYVGGYSNATWGSPVGGYSAGDDTFVAKLNSTTGNLTWHTFLGGSGSDLGHAIAVDGSGNVYVGGSSSVTWGSPVQPFGGSTDTFAAKLNGATGNLTWNTFLGGSGNDYGYAIAVDSGGDVYVGGESSATWGSPVQPFGGSTDTFAAKLNPSGTLLWNTFLGGSGGDYGRAIAVDGSGNVYVGGYSNATWGSPVRGYTAGDDTFAAKLNGTTGNLTWNTFLGGSGADNSSAIAVDGSGNVYVGGYSNATWGSPVWAFSGGRDAFAAKLDSSGALTWNTFLGGIGNDYGNAIAVDGSGNIYLGGYSDYTWGSPVQTYTGSTDAFAAKLAPDTTPPSLQSFTRSNPSASSTNAATLVFRATFSEAVQNVDAADFQINATPATTATITSVTPVSASVYEITLSGGDLASHTYNGTIGLNLAAGQNITDLDGNALPNGEPATDETYTVDNTAPTLQSFTRFNPLTSPTNAATLVFRATFSEAVQNVDAADFQINAAPATTATITSVTQVSASVYNITVSGGDLASHAYNGVIGLNLAAGQNITDLAGNALPNGEPTTDETYTVDNIGPSVTVNQAAGQPDPTNSSPILFVATFSESINTATFTAADVTLGGTANPTTATITEIAPNDGTTFQIAVSGMTGSGTVTASIPAGNVQDPAGNANTASASTDNTVTYDTGAPALVSFTRSNPPTSPTNAATLVFRATFSEDVKNVGIADFQINATPATSATITGVTQISASLYEITVSGGDLGGHTYNGTIGLDLANTQNITDLAGNALPTTEPATDDAYTVDNTGPSVTVEQAAGQPDPTNSSPILFVATFSESINTATFTAADVTLGGTANPTTATITEIAPNDGTTFQIAVSGMTGSGTVTASIPAGSVQDPAGNTNTASASTDNTVTYDTGAPALVSFTLSNPPTSPTNAATLVFRATFSEDVQNVDVADFQINATPATTATITSVTQVSPSVYEITVSGGDLASHTYNGTIGLDLAAGQNITDLAGNALPTTEPSTDETYTVDNQAVLVAAHSLQATYSPTGPSSFTVTFNKAVNDPAGNSDPDDVTNPANYLLIEKGVNAAADTVSCAGGPAGDDVQKTVTAVSYNNTTYTSTVTLAGALPVGNYRLFVCGTTSIVDLAGNPLNGGTDFTFDFVVQPAATTLPATGFPMGRVTFLLPQTESYTALGDLWLEIPRLGVRAEIVGVPNGGGTWDVSWLGSNAGWLEGTAFPTWAGNSVITGHVYDANGQAGPFVNLNRLWYGDRVIVHAWGQEYVYEVRSVQQVQPGDTSLITRHEEYPWLTLVTCRGYDEGSHSYRYRVVVRAVQVDIR